jgi:hypothetical protein
MLAFSEKFSFRLCAAMYFAGSMTMVFPGHKTGDYTHKPPEKLEWDAIYAFF